MEGNVLNKLLYINFDRKSLVIPKVDFEIFKSVSYQNDKFGSIFYPKDEERGNDVLLVLDLDNNPKIFVFFQEVMIQNEFLHEIISIKILNDEIEIDPKSNFKETQYIVSDLLKITFNVLDRILKDNLQFEKANWNLCKYKYLIRNKENHTYTQIMNLKARAKYEDLFSELDYGFAVMDEE